MKIKTYSFSSSLTTGDDFQIIEHSSSRAKYLRLNRKEAIEIADFLITALGNTKAAYNKIVADKNKDARKYNGK